MCAICQQCIDSFKILSKDILLGKDSENSSLTEIRKWLKCKMKVMREDMGERKKRITRMPVHLHKC